MDQQGEIGAARPERPGGLRTAPPGVLPYYLAVEVTAVVLPFAVPSPVPTVREWVFFAVLLGSAVVQTELSAKAERMRRFLASNPHVTVTSVWFFAGALSLPPLLAVVLAVLVYGHFWLRTVGGVPGARPYRAACSVATHVVTVFAVHAAAGLFGGLAGTAAGGLTFVLVNNLLVLIGFKLHDPACPFLSFAGSASENLLDAATLCLGAAAAALLVVRPLLVPLLVLPLVLLHRGELGRRLELRARDPKTGLLSIAQWRTRAEAELGRAARAGGHCAILMLDLDHFKRVNDTYGHLAGDDVLRAVADAVRGEVRIYDAVGRFGGEEFVVLLPGIGQVHSVAVAERIRDAVAELAVVVADGTRIAGLSVSIGVAVHPDAGREVDEVLGAADKAVYAAKNAGRDRVCVSRCGIARPSTIRPGARASPDGAAS
ncbi:GGDEF domain-containing protein [Amycolatopsis sp. NBRC 101858]|uniref:GGDEF domain-containing protein n=1 Tax=Amycolatopsis sp. NBRC 101858 TaxID=3032200 RepID=UPI0024A2AEEC|nr:GGDEF domain-containing protein [Amycolatopsis sp. NBRC 101858]GLY37320.1 GGDEF domain-containing protein [Amycolatopsis sp. NBRC 101858]